MIGKSYTREIIVSNTPRSAYRALTSEFDKWWAPSKGLVTTENDTVTFQFEQTYWTMRVTKLLPNEIIELECVEAHHIHEGMPDSILKEWEGTKLKWQIQQLGENTKIIFVHEGLIPSLACFEICEEGWDHFFVHSLKDYLDKGKGNPFA